MMLHLQHRPERYSTEVWSALEALIEFRSASEEVLGALDFLGRISASNVEVLENGETARVMGLACDFDEFAGPLIDRLGRADGKVAFHCAWAKLVEGRQSGTTATYIEKEYRKSQRLEAGVIYLSTALATDFETIQTLVDRSFELYSPSRIEIRCAIASHAVTEMKAAGAVNTHALLILPEYRTGHHQNTFGNMLCRLPDIRQRSTFMPTYIGKSALPGLRPGW